MLLLARAVTLVSQTEIFARSGREGRQLLAYKMAIELEDDLAMVLPLPVPPSPADDAALAT